MFNQGFTIWSHSSCDRGDTFAPAHGLGEAFVLFGSHSSIMDPPTAVDTMPIGGGGVVAFDIINPSVSASAK